MGRESLCCSVEPVILTSAEQQPSPQTNAEKDHPGMRIVQLAAGAGEMYCGTCLYANTLASALAATGHDVVLVPAYTPLRAETASISRQRVVFGGINVYLQQASALFRRTPWGLDRLLDHPWLLRWAGHMASATDPRRLGPMTVSMLQGHDGRQRKELDKLVDWLSRELKPDIVHMSTGLLVGMARQIAEDLRIPVIATLTGEDSFVEHLPEPYYRRTRDLLAERCSELAALLTMNHYFADYMSEYLGIARRRFDVIPPGLDLGGYGPRLGESDAEEFTIGFLARICPDKGLHILADAFSLLSRDATVPPARLRVAGYLSKNDRDYLAGIRTKLAQRGLEARFEYLGELDRARKITFFQSLDAMSLPTVYRECKGLPVLEAWACGVPAVLPDHGAFPEMIRDSGGGLLCRANDPESLADCLKELIRNRTRAAELGRCGYEAAHGRYHAGLMAERTDAVYQRVARNHARGFGPADVEG